MEETCREVMVREGLSSNSKKLHSEAEQVCVSTPFSATLQRNLQLSGRETPNTLIPPSEAATGQPKGVIGTEGLEFPKRRLIQDERTSNPRALLRTIAFPINEEGGAGLEGGYKVLELTGLI
ncbi:hypothetical protein CRENBAI_020683 [Crenichthys baileyi]|uniref:Uncharacterized protein n=1 Tax=Crenichthys baileyi TaxID=28760 RepID=A0AAV9RZW3_9TELE